MQQDTPTELLPSYLNLKGSFEEQVRYIMQNVRLSRQEVDHINLLYMNVEGALQSSWPGCKVVPFGSIVTGLGIKTSDVDCFVDISGHGHTKNINHRANVVIARNILRRQHWLFQETFAITTAKVPIVKFFHTPTQRYCDINFTSPAGVRNSNLLAYLLHLDRRAANLAILIKYWAKVHNLTGTNKIPNYGLTLLVIFYLQHINILPSVIELQRNGPTHIVEGWNTAFCENFQTDFQTDNHQSLYELLGGFFKFYSTLNFAKIVISPFTGTLLNRNDFKPLGTEMLCPNVPNTLELYKSRISSKECKPLRIDTQFCVQDPFEHNRNCTMSVFPKLAIIFLSHLNLAAQMYEQNSKDFYIIDLLARKPPLTPEIKEKGNLNKLNTTKEQFKKARPSKKKRTLCRSLDTNLEKLWRKMK